MLLLEAQTRPQFASNLGIIRKYPTSRHTFKFIKGRIYTVGLPPSRCTMARFDVGALVVCGARPFVRQRCSCPFLVLLTCSWLNRTYLHPPNVLAVHDRSVGGGWSALYLGIPYSHMGYDRPVYVEEISPHTDLFLLLP